MADEVKKTKIIASAIIQAIAIISLTIYGIKLADLGIDSTLALTIGVIIGGIGGFNVKKLKEILGGK